MKLLIIVPDGVGVRNYLYSSFIQELEKKNIDVFLYHQLSDSAISEIKLAQPNLKEFRQIPEYKESIKSRLLRESLAFARLKYNSRKLKNPTVMDFWNRKFSSFKSILLYLISEILGSLFSVNYKLILKFESIYDRLLLKDKISKLIKKDIELLSPDFILNLHQRSPISAPIIALANTQNIKTATVIFSWDNVPKARLISRYNKYFVWSDLMKSELSFLYPEINKKCIEVVGTPQFEFYFDTKYIISKKDFFENYGLDITKKTICFSANDSSSLYEQIYLKDICEIISSIDEVDRPQLIFRRSPVDKSNRFDTIIAQYKKLICVIDPDWKSDSDVEKSFVSLYPRMNDIFLLVNTVKHSDLVINFGSTMAHDFAVYNKPCLYLNYDPVKNAKIKVGRIYRFQHFNSLKNLEAVSWVNSKLEMWYLIKRGLDEPEKMGKDRIIWMRRIVKFPLENCSHNIVQSILN
jgi:hypothetical protein